jgi:arsenate reductase
MKATIYHNPKCGTSRKTLEILEAEGAEVTVRDYLADPPCKEELRSLYERAGIAPRDGLRAKEPLARDLDLVEGAVSDEAILDAMAANPILINRPLVETEKACASAALRTWCARYSEGIAGGSRRAASAAPAGRLQVYFRVAGKAGAGCGDRNSSTGTACSIASGGCG